MHAWCYESIKTFPADNLRPGHLSTQYLYNIYEISTQYLLIIYADLPTSRPHIYGLRSVYPVGALLNLSCESGPSSPPPVSTVLHCHCTVLDCTVLYRSCTGS